MPIYEIECTCGNKQEVYLKVDQEPSRCPKCGHQMKKMISATTFILRGRGWANDGYGLYNTKKVKGKQNAK
ncbi:zinc ribbon domain-containing protein [candidate division WOR-3 bacterium]|nr:zinc ribbon domain-containing protein [candidate division WOR-3 bacterium]